MPPEMLSLKMDPLYLAVLQDGRDAASEQKSEEQCVYVLLKENPAPAGGNRT